MKFTYFFILQFSKETRCYGKFEKFHLTSSILNPQTNSRLDNLASIFGIASSQVFFCVMIKGISFRQSSLEIRMSFFLDMKKEGKQSKFTLLQGRNYLIILRVTPKMNGGLSSIKNFPTTVSISKMFLLCTTIFVEIKNYCSVKKVVW